MMTKEKDNRAGRNPTPEWNWFSVERGRAPRSAGASVTKALAGRLQAVYPLRSDDEPEAIRKLMAALAAKDL